MATKVCNKCGTVKDLEEYHRSPDGDGHRAVCKQCISQARYDRQGGPKMKRVQPKQCETCSVPFMPSGPQRRYCSKKCGGIAKKITKPIRKCRGCGNSFVAMGKGKRRDDQEFCTVECWYEYARKNPDVWPRFNGGRFPYYGPNWRQQARMTRKRDQYTCQDCGAKQEKKAFPVHHIKPRRTFAYDHIAANDLSNLITLCPSCHILREHQETANSPDDYNGVPPEWLPQFPTRRTIEERFWPKVDKSGECWLWLANKTKTGFGQFGIEAGDSRYAHKVAYELLVGPVPEGKTLYQRCENNSCVNPAHMDVVDRHPYFVRTHCAKWHLFDDENTYVKPDGRRGCRTCRKQYHLSRKAKGQIAS